MSNPEQRRIKDIKELKRAQYDADMLKVLSTAEGRRFMWRLIDDTCRTFSSSFTGNSTSFFNDGVRSVGLHVLKEVERLSPAEAVHMYQEQLKAKAKDESYRNDAEARSKAEAQDGYGDNADADF